jgi:hypothetical protein
MDASIADRVPVYQFTLTKGKSTSSDESRDLRRMDRLRDTLLSAFEQFTSSRAKDVWGKAHDWLRFGEFGFDESRFRAVLTRDNSGAVGNPHTRNFADRLG